MDRTRSETKDISKLYEQLKKEEMELDEQLVKLKKLTSEKKNVMDALHRYNDIKDATQVVLGQLANIYGVTTAELHKKFDLSTEE